MANLEDKRRLRAVACLRQQYQELLSAHCPQVAAVPEAMLPGSKEEDMRAWFRWHVTLMAPEGSPFEGLLLPLTLEFPEDYPLTGPKADLKSTLNHGHVYGSWICLSILNDYIPCHGTDRKEAWSFAYSIESVLHQLQSFLFDPDEEDGVGGFRAQPENVLRAFRSAAAVCCKKSGHRLHNPVPCPPGYRPPAHSGSIDKEADPELYKAALHLEASASNDPFPTSLLTVQIPSYSRPGDKVIVTAPSGACYECVHPEGVRPQEHIRVRVPRHGKICTVEIEASLSSIRRLCCHHTLTDGNATTVSLSSTKRPAGSKSGSRASGGKAGQQSTTSNSSEVQAQSTYPAAATGAGAGAGRSTVSLLSRLAPPTSTASMSTKGSNKSSASAAGGATVLERRKGSVECVVLSCENDNGVVLRATAASNGSEACYLLPRSDAMKVDWDKDGTMKMVLRVKEGEHLTVWPLARGGRNGNNHRMRVSLEPPRPRTRSQGSQRSLVSKIGAEQLRGCWASEAEVFRVVESGLLVALGPLSKPTTNTTLAAVVPDVPGGLVALLRFADLIGGKTARVGDQLSNGVWIKRVDATGGRLEASAFPPVDLSAAPSPATAKIPVVTVTPMLGEVAKIMGDPLSPGGRQRAILNLPPTDSSSGSSGSLSLDSVRSTFDTARKNGCLLGLLPALLWELRAVCDVGDVIGVKIQERRAGTNNDPHVLVLDISHLTSSSTSKAAGANSTTLTRSKKRGAGCALFELSDSILLQCLAFLGRGDLSCLSAGFGNVGSTDVVRGGRRLSGAASAASPQRLGWLADMVSVRRYARGNFRCAFTRQSMEQEVLGVGFNITLHGSSNSQDMRRSYQRLKDEEDAEEAYVGSYAGPVLLSDCIAQSFEKSMRVEGLDTMGAEQIRQVMARVRNSTDGKSEDKVKPRPQKDTRRNVENVSPIFLNYLSFRAFHRWNVKQTAWNDGFTHWLPLWISRSHGVRAAPLALQTAAAVILNDPGALSRSCLLKGSKAERERKQPEQRQVLQAFATFVTKAMNSSVVAMMSGDLHESEVALEGYFQLYQLLLGVASMFPELQDLLTQRVRSFLENPAARSKTHAPSLGELLPLLPLAGVPWAEAVVPFLREAFVRNARWALRACPDLADIDGTRAEGAVSDHRRLEETLKANRVSLKLLAFHCVAADLVLAECGDTIDVQRRHMETRFGLPSAAAVSQLQGKTKVIKDMKSWTAFFEAVHLPPPSEVFLASWLRETVRLSRENGYHNQRHALELVRAVRRQAQAQAQAQEQDGASACSGAADASYDMDE